MANKVINENTYATPIRPRIMLTVEAITDMVPGAFHDITDLMNWICQNPYVVSVEMKED